MEEQSMPAKETELETPDQSIDRIERRETESTPMPNIEEQEKNRQWRRGDQHTGDDKRRLRNEENVVYREDCCDGRNEAKREGGDNDSDREKQNIWDSFDDNDGNQEG